ncbi:MAG TPA: hypothetical protein VEG44_06210 [Candidatus Acidoferrales bacterium]|nr:hypothetical protein [Candidatus Acidoferrales bacterium]
MQFIDLSNGEKLTVSVELSYHDDLSIHVVRKVPLTYGASLPFPQSKARKTLESQVARELKVITTFVALMDCDQGLLAYSYVQMVYSGEELKRFDSTLLLICD